MAVSFCSCFLTFIPLTEEKYQMVPQNEFSSGEKFFTNSFITRRQKGYNTILIHRKQTCLVVNTKYFKGVSREDRKLGQDVAKCTQMLQENMTKTTGIKLRKREFITSNELCRFCGKICVVAGKSSPMAAAVARPGWTKDQKIILHCQT